MKVVVAVVAVVFAVVGSFGVALQVRDAGAFHGSSQVRVEEDQPGWDCRTMGNGVCGSDLPGRVPGERVEEDDPRFDCRVDGNRVCGEGIENYV